MNAMTLEQAISHFEVIFSREKDMLAGYVARSLREYKETKAQNERLEREADWLAKELAQNDNATVHCRNHCDHILPCLRDCRAKKWREAARKAVVQPESAR